MNRRRNLTTKRGQQAIAILIGIGASFLLTMTTLAYRGTVNPFQIPSKQQTLQQMLSAQATAEAQQPRIAKISVAAPAALSSCLGPAPSTVIMQGDNGRFKQEKIVDSVGAVPVGNLPFYALIFAGARGANAQQGLFIVEREPKDACLPSSVGNQVLYYDTPYQRGALTLNAVSGDSVIFTTAAGTTGHFNFVTGQFS